MADPATGLQDPPNPPTPPGDDPLDHSTSNLDDNNPKTFSESVVRELREEAKKRRLELREAQARIAELQRLEDERVRAKLEEEKKYQELVELERSKFRELETKYSNESKQFSEKILRAEIRAKAVEAGIVDPSDIETLPLENVTVEQIPDFVESLKTTKKHWFKPTSSDAPPAPPRGTVPPGPSRGTPKGSSAFDLSADEFRKKMQEYGVNLS